MAILKIEKVNTLPGVYTASTLYMVKNATNVNLFDLYLSTSDGSSVRHIISEGDIDSKINNALAAMNTALVVADITERDALTLNTVTTVLVLNATGDPTVEVGGATYIYNPATTTFYKIAEHQTIDAVINWTDIVGRPTSSPAAIDSAVTNSHTHTNKSLLDGLSEVGNHLYLNGAPVRAYLEVESW